MVEILLLAIAIGVFCIAWQLQKLYKFGTKFASGYVKGRVWALGKHYEVEEKVKEFERRIGRKSTLEDLPEFEKFMADEGWELGAEELFDSLDE